MAFKLTRAIPLNWKIHLDVKEQASVNTFKPYRLTIPGEQIITRLKFNLNL